MSQQHFHKKAKILSKVLSQTWLRILFVRATRLRWHFLITVIDKDTACRLVKAVINA